MGLQIYLMLVSAAKITHLSSKSYDHNRIQQEQRT